MSIKKLAGQTFWYGFSNILGRFLNYLLTPLLTGIYSSDKYGDISILFAMAAFLNVVFTYGMETSYFRFNNSHPEKDVYDTGMTSMIGTTIIFDISSTATGSLLRFIHQGLVPEFQCYKSCSGAWGFLIRESLVALIATGKGKPVRKGQFGG